MFFQAHHAYSNTSQCEAKASKEAKTAKESLSFSPPMHAKADSRTRLRHWYWQEVQSYIQVVLSIRDLRGHLTTNAHLNAATLTTRRLAKAYALAMHLFLTGCERPNHSFIHSFIHSIIYVPRLFCMGPSCKLEDGEMAHLPNGLLRMPGCHCSCARHRRPWCCGHQNCVHL